jgi:hypothetical protein
VDHGAFKERRVSQAMRSSKKLDNSSVQTFDPFQSQKPRLAHSAGLRGKSA